MSVAQRRDAVRSLVAYGVSVTRACVIVQVQRATFLYKARSPSDAGLVEEITQLALAQPRYGYRRVWAVLRRTRSINRKRVHRLWKRSKLQVKRVSRHRVHRERPARLSAAYPNHIWAYDFLFDHDAHGRVLGILTVMDEFTREGLALDVDTTTSAQRVVGVLERLVATQGAPDYIRSDNGAEFVAGAVQAWLANEQIRTLYIDPGCPWQNGKDERFNGTVRDECLNLQLFASVNEARVRLETFRQHYNCDRPHSRLSYQTPVAFKEMWNQTQAESSDSHIPT